MRMQQDRVIKYLLPIQDQRAQVRFTVLIQQGALLLPEVTHRGALPLREAVLTVAPHRGAAHPVRLHEAHTAVPLREAAVILLEEAQAVEVRVADIVAPVAVPEEGDNEKVYCINT